MRIIHLLTLCLSLFCVDLRAEEPLKNPIPEVIAQSAFCVAYAFRDADARDTRPNHPEDPFGDPGGESIQYGSILNSDSLIDVAALTSRVVAQARVSKSQITTVCKAVIDGNARFPVMECYDPHHAIVFYSYTGKPMCCIEICFTCNQVKISPEFRTMEAVGHSYERTDLITLARLFDELKLTLFPFSSFEELKKGHEALLTKEKSDSESK